MTDSMICHKASSEKKEKEKKREVKIVSEKVGKHERCNA